MNKKDVWKFLNLELARISETASAYDKLFSNIDVQGDSFNHAIQLILDGWSRSMSVGLSLFFDKRKDSWSLKRFTELDQKAITAVENTAKEILDLRMSRYAHISKNVTHRDNFAFLTDKGLEVVSKSISDIHQQLNLVGKHNQYNSEWAVSWPQIESSVDLLIEFLKSAKFDTEL